MSYPIRLILMKIFSLGVNWRLTPTFGLNLNYRYTVLGREGVRGGSHGMMARVIPMPE
jgi:hypothetical protein